MGQLHVTHGLVKPLAEFNPRYGSFEAAVCWDHEITLAKGYKTLDIPHKICFGAIAINQDPLTLAKHVPCSHVVSIHCSRFRVLSLRLLCCIIVHTSEASSYTTGSEVTLR